MAKKALVLLLGGNVGDRLLNIKNAVDLLCKEWGNPLKTSSIYESPAWGFQSEDFLNLAIVFDSDLEAMECLRMTQKIENDLGRKEKSKDGKYQARIMDIDILYYGDAIFESKDLSIPHPRIEERRFVLEPLLEIMPLFQDPKSGLRITDLWEKCPDGSSIKRLNEHI